MSKDSGKGHYVQGLRYLSGTDFEQNFELALFHFRKAAIENHIEAQCNLGLMHSRGLGCDLNLIRAYKWLHLAMEGGSKKAIVLMDDIAIKCGSLMKSESYLQVKHFKENLKLYQSASYKNNSVSQYALGKRYYDGLGVDVDYVEAARYHLLAANQGNMDAQFHLGLQHEQGHGVTKSLSESLQWFIASADNGHPEAQYRSGSIFGNHTLPTYEPDKAVHYFHLASENKHRLAQLELGQIYKYGTKQKTVSKQKTKFAEVDKKIKYGFASKYDDVASELVPPKNDRLEKAKLFFELAAKQGIAEAQCQLGIMFSHGEGTAQNYEEAVHYFRLACAQGNPKAMSNLGFHYFHGLGVDENIEKSYVWYYLGEKLGYKHADNNIDMILKKLSKQQIEQYTELAETCLRRKFVGFD